MHVIQRIKNNGDLVFYCADVGTFAESFVHDPTMFACKSDADAMAKHLCKNHIPCEVRSIGASVKI